MQVTVNGFMGATQIYGLGHSEQKFPIGLTVTGWSEYVGDWATPNLFGQYMYIKNDSNSARTVGQPVMMNDNLELFDTYTTANLGAPIMITASKMAVSEYGWVQLAGYGPVAVDNAFGSSRLFFGALATKLYDTATASKHILNITELVAPTRTFTVTGKTTNGSKVVKLKSTRGLWVGLTISGTGIPASTTVADINDGDNTVTMSAAATASGSITVTFTLTGFGLCHFQYPHTQGQIT